ncbi:hypothetical protein ACA910_018410 [Epithemia clementina (nom. ined.)]
MSTTTKRTVEPTLKELPIYDLSQLSDENGVECMAKGGVACPFPWRLHICLDAVEKEGLEDILSWQSHGRSFTVYQPDKFVQIIMPRFFGQTKYRSFQRQLNIYGFSRFQQGKDKGAYYHLCFVRNQRSLIRHMVRRKIKGNCGFSRRMPVDETYDFYNPAWKNHNQASIPAVLDKKKSALDEEQRASVVILYFLNQ